MIKKKVTFFCGFFWLYHGKAVAGPVYEKVTGKQRLCVHNPQKVHCIHFCLGVPNTIPFKKSVLNKTRFRSW